MADAMFGAAHVDGWRSVLRGWNMTGSSDSVKWPVLVAIVAPLSVALLGMVGGALYQGGGVSQGVQTLTTEIGNIKTQLSTQAVSMSSDTKQIRDQLGVQANTLTHLEDEFHFGGTRMDNQERELDLIKTQLEALKAQVAEKQVPRK
jgi:hypothetical protein